MLNRFGLVALVVGAILIGAAALAGSASAYNLEPSEARFIAAAHTKAVYDFRLQSELNVSHSSVWVERIFTRIDTNRVRIDSSRGWALVNPWPTEIDMHFQTTVVKGSGIPGSTYTANTTSSCDTDGFYNCSTVFTQGYY